MRGYEAFVVELKESVDVCVKRNTHQRTQEEIENVNNFVFFLHVHIQPFMQVYMYMFMYAFLSH